MSISACMIVRDEEQMLAGCLDSIHDWVDEIIVVDTGSKDKTVAIAGGYKKVRLYHQKWRANFSLHRNYSMDQATGDWIFTIDADERVPKEDGIAMSRMLRDGIKCNIIVIDLLNVYGDERVARSRAPQMRFFRRALNVRYDRAIHNRPDIKDTMPVYRVPFRVIHYGYDLSPEKMMVKYKRTKRMCKALTKKEPDNAEAWFHYARAIKVKHGKFDMDILPEMEKAVQTGINLQGGTNDRQNIYLQLLYFMSVIKYMKKDFAASVECSEKALAIKPDYLDALFMAGFAYTYGLDVAKGEAYFRRYLSEQEIYDFSDVVDSISMEHASSRAEVYSGLVNIEKHKDQACRVVPNAQEVESAI